MYEKVGIILAEGEGYEYREFGPPGPGQAFEGITAHLEPRAWR